MVKCFALTLLLICVASRNAPAGTVSFVDTTPAAKVGDNVFINVDTTNISDLYGFQFDVNFNPLLLSAISVSEGGFLQRGGTTSFIAGIISNGLGSITGDADTLVGPVRGVSGSGELLQIEFRALATGESEISFANSIFLNSALNNITPNLTFENASVEIGSIHPVPEPSTLTIVAPFLLLFLACRSRFGERILRVIFANSVGLYVAVKSSQRPLTGITRLPLRPEMRAHARRLAAQQQSG